MREHDRIRTLKLERLKDALAEGEASGLASDCSVERLLSDLDS
jgi:hypothetical protein